MPYQKMPNGAYVDIPDDITPEGYAKVYARYTPKAAPASRAAPTVDKRAGWEKGLDNVREAGERFMEPLDTFNDNAVHNMTLGAGDLIGAGVNAATQGKSFKDARAEIKRRREARNERNPVSGGVGKVAGILTNPLGAKTGVSALATKVAPGLTKAVKGSAVGKLISNAGESAIGLGARAGFNQGFVTGAVDKGNLPDALNEGAINAVVGGAATALLKGGKVVYDVARNQSKGAANRVAMERIAKMLDRSEDPLTKQPYTPATMRQEIKATDAAGGDARLMDITPEGQSWASYLSKQPGNAQASHLVNEAETRAGGAAERFDERVRKQLSIGPKAKDAYDTKKGIAATRKAAAARDYSPEVMDRQLAWNDDLAKFFKKDNPVVREALDRAEYLIKAEDGDVTQLAFSKMGDPKSSTMTKVPSMGVMDKVKKGFDSKIEDALSGIKPNKEAARMYSMQLRKLKDELAKVNPEYGAALANQRDLFERSNSVDLGMQVLARLKKGKNEARVVLDELKDGRIKPDDLKIGFADALMDLRTKPGGENPVALMRRMMRSTEQRDVLSHLFGGKKSLAEFERFMRRELRTSDTDAMVSSGRQMQQNLLRETAPGGDVETLSDIGKGGLQGMAFGGPVGAVSRMISNTTKWSHMLSPSAKAELSRLLSGKGDDLEAGLKKLKREALKARAQGRKAATATGKAPYAVVGGYSEQ